MDLCYFHVWSVNVRNQTPDEIKADPIDNLMELIITIDKIFFLSTHTLTPNNA